MGAQRYEPLLTSPSTPYLLGDKTRKIMDFYVECVLIKPFTLGCRVSAARAVGGVGPAGASMVFLGYPGDFEVGRACS